MFNMKFLSLFIFLGIAAAIIPPPEQNDIASLEKRGGCQLSCGTIDAHVECGGSIGCDEGEKYVEKYVSGPFYAQSTYAASHCEQYC